MIGVRNLRADYNAPGDGSDQTTIITHWLSDCLSDGSIAFAPPGNYGFTSLPVLTSSIIVRGAGFQTRFTHLPGAGGPGFTVGQSTLTVDFPWVALEDVTVVGNGSDTHGIYFSAPTNNQYLRLTRVQSNHWGGDGVHVENSQSTTYADVIASANGGWGMHFSALGGGANNVTTVVGGNVALNRLGGILNENAAGLSLVGVSLQGNHGVQLQLGDGVHAFRRTTLLRVHIEGSNAPIGLLIRGNVQDITCDGLFVTQQYSGGVGLQLDAGGSPYSPANVWILGGEIGGAETPSPRPPALVVKDGTQNVVLSPTTILDGPIQNTTPTPIKHVALQ